MSTRILFSRFLALAAAGVLLTGVFAGCQTKTTTTTMTASPTPDPKDADTIHHPPGQPKRTR